MTRRMHAGLFAGLALAALAVPATAAAHDLLGGGDPNRPVVDYLWLGFRHMVAGWDHLLFIAGAVLLADRFGRAAKLITVFVLGHSITLMVATLAGWQLSPTAVDVLIALSVAYVGVEGLRGGAKNWTRITAVVFAFGLVHGLGLSTRLQALGLPEDGLVWRILVFNVGIELGQLAAVAVILGIGTLVARLLHRPALVRRVAYGGLIGVGVVAAAVLAFPSGTEEPEREAAAPASSCDEAEYTPEFGGFGGHPDKRVYEADEPTPDEDLNHILGDGFVVVRYDPRSQMRSARRSASGSRGRTWPSWPPRATARTKRSGR